MWLYRAYNGYGSARALHACMLKLVLLQFPHVLITCRYKYSQGVCNSSGGPKINKGDTVRCELDMDAGSLQLLINGSLAATFTGLQVHWLAVLTHVW